MNHLKQELLMSEIVILHKINRMDISESVRLGSCVKLDLHCIQYGLLQSLLLSGFNVKPQSTFSAITQFYDHSGGTGLSFPPCRHSQPALLLSQKKIGLLIQDETVLFKQYSAFQLLIHNISNILLFQIFLIIELKNKN